MVTLGGGGGFDLVLFEFIRGNFFTMGLVLGTLKILARKTKWTGDDEIVSMLLNIVGSVRKGKGVSNVISKDVHNNSTGG